MSDDVEAAPAAPVTLDRIDREILRLLSDDASLSLAEIAAKVGLTPTPCWWSPRSRGTR